MKVTFHNVTITIEAPSEKEAYDRLDLRLGEEVACIAYTTDSFTTDADPDRDRDTSELWPEPPFEEV